MLNPDYQIADDEQREFQLPPDALKDRVIMITGATGGLGTALCKACAAAGATLVLSGRRVPKLEKLYDHLLTLTQATPAIVPLEQDKAGPAQYEELADLIEREFGQLDGLVHTSAESGTATHQMSIEHAEWQRIMNVNLTSARLLSLYQQTSLMKSTLGSQVFLLDHKPGAYWGTYGVSKQALHALMNMLADESENQKDTMGFPVMAVNGYDPGPLRTALRRRTFPGELPEETPLPEARLGPLLWLLSRQDRSLSGRAIQY